MSRVLLRGMLPLAAVTLLVGALPETARAWQDFTPQKIELPQPGQREFISDRANLINEADRTKIREICNRLLTDKATPIIVVTINSMSEYGGGGLRIETFARLLFDQWEIGQAKLRGESWNTGMLLLVSRDDRKARIELGAGWKREQDSQSQQIMNELMVPHFRQGDYSTGILAGVEALDKLGRGLVIPRPPVPPWKYFVGIGAIGLMLFTMVSLMRRGASGWAWIFWGIVFAGIGTILYQMLQNSRHSGGGGGFSGGSFGGGFSGGGGATGSW